MIFFLMVLRFFAWKMYKQQSKQNTIQGHLFDVILEVRRCFCRCQHLQLFQSILFKKFSSWFYSNYIIILKILSLCDDNFFFVSLYEVNENCYKKINCWAVLWPEILWFLYRKCKRKSSPSCSPIWGRTKQTHWKYQTTWVSSEGVWKQNVRFFIAKWCATK